MVKRGEILRNRAWKSERVLSFSEERIKKEKLIIVPFLCGIIWCLSCSFWGYYCNLASLANKIKIKQREKTMLSSVIIEEFVFLKKIKNL